MSSNFAALVAAGEAAMREGKGLYVARLVAGANWVKCPRNLRLPAANLCRRAGLLHIGLKILAPIVRLNKARPASSATPAELAEYSVLLQRSGAVPEALRTLESIDTTQAPEADLYRAFCLFNIWEYEKALEPLQRYLTNAPSPYLRLVARINLLAALTATRRLELAEQEFAVCLASAIEQGASRLEANAREIHAQILIAQNRDSDAAADLDRSVAIIRNDASLEALFVKKWRAVLESRKTKSTRPLSVFRRIALRAGDGESVREADLFALAARFHRGRFDRLWFGTPFPAYRKRIALETHAVPRSSYYAFGTGDGRARRVDLLTGDHSLKPGKLPHQVLSVLLRDFYRPPSVGALFSELYREEFFNPFTSPDRVHQALRRTRLWLLSENIPARIVEHDGCYSLQIVGPVFFLVSLMNAPFDSRSARLSQLKRLIGTESSFTARQVSDLLKMSLATSKRIIAWAETERFVMRFGSGALCSYRFLESK